MPHKSKKEATHEVIKDIEGVTTRLNALHKADIRNITVPQLLRFLDTRTNNNYTDKKLFSMFKHTSQFLKQNDNLMVTRADKGNAVVVMDKEEFTKNAQPIKRSKYILCSKERFIN